MRRSVDLGDRRTPAAEAYAAACDWSLTTLLQVAVDFYMNAHPKVGAAGVQSGCTPASDDARQLARGGADGVHGRTPGAPQMHPECTTERAQPPSPSPTPPPTPGGDGLSLFPLPSTQTPPLQDGGSTTSARVELEWRVLEVWGAYLRTREAFWKRENGRVPPAPERPRKEVRGYIVAALREFDAERMGADDRDRWRRESPVRAAGQGVWLSDWHTGHAKDNDIASGGKRFLEDWRPWKRLQGKGSPVPMFAAIAWEARNRA